MSTEYHLNVFYKCAIFFLFYSSWSWHPIFTRNNTVYGYWIVSILNLHPKQIDWLEFGKHRIIKFFLGPPSFLSLKRNQRSMWLVIRFILDIEISKNQNSSIWWHGSSLKWFTFQTYKTHSRHPNRCDALLLAFFSYNLFI